MTSSPRILIFAFSTFAPFFREAIRISRESGDNTHWGVVIPRASYLHFFDDQIPSEDRLYLYQEFNSFFRGMPPSPSLSGAEDNLERIMAIDKDGYRHEEGVFQRRWAATALALYRRFLDRFAPDCVIFPPLETVEGALLLSLCQERGIRCLHVVHMRNLGYSFFSESLYERLPKYFGIVTDDAREMARRFIDDFLAGKRRPSDMPEGADRGRRASYSPRPLLLRIIHNIRYRLTKERHYRGEDTFIAKIKVNLAKPLYAYRKLRHRLTESQYFDVTPRAPDLPSRYILYAAQVSPESSINTLAQFYIDQTRVIDLLRFAMPDGCTLLVKEHPAMAGSRPSSFYRYLKRCPGVLSVAPTIPVESLLPKAELVATVSGTIGLESYLLDKPCLIFGRNFFAHLCRAADRVDALRQEIATLLADYRPANLGEKVEAIARLYAVAYPFALFEPFYRPEVLAEQNVVNFLNGLHDHLRRCASMPTVTAS